MKKTICLILVLIMSVSVLACSCKTNSGGESSAAESSSPESTDTNSEVSKASDIKGYNEELQKYEATIPEGVTYEGTEFKFLTCSVNQEHESEIVFNTYEDGGEEGMATVVNEAIAERNNLVKDKLGVTITEECVYDAKRKNGEFCNRIRTDIAASSGDYYVCVPCLYDGATLASDGKLYDLCTISTIDLENPWWSQAFNDECKIGGKLFFTLSDIGYVSASSVPALAFNKKWIETYNLDDPYQLVRDKQWTLDKVIEMTKTHVEDLDNDGATTYTDVFGWAGQYDDMWSLFYGSGEKIASVGSDGYPVLSIYNERSVKVIDKMQELVQNKTYYVCANDYFNVVQWPTTLTMKAFVEGRCLFFNGGLGSTSDYASMSDDFGLLPMPLLDETQESYHSLTNPWVSTCFAVPLSVSEDKLDMVGNVLEVMGAESKNHVEKQFIETVLQYQKTRDDDTWDMISNYILPSKGCDIGFFYAWGGLDTLLQDMATAPEGSFASKYDAVKDAAQDALDKTADLFKNS